MTEPCIFAQGLTGGPEIVGPSLPFSSKTNYPPRLLWDCYFGGVPGFLSIKSVLHWIHQQVHAACSCVWAVSVGEVTASPSMPLSIHTAVRSQQPCNFFSRLCLHSSLCHSCCSVNKFWVFWFGKLRKIKILQQLRKCGFKPTSIIVSPFNWHCLNYIYQNLIPSWLNLSSVASVPLGYRKQAPLPSGLSSSPQTQVSLSCPPSTPELQGLLLLLRRPLWSSLTVVTVLNNLL